MKIKSGIVGLGDDGTAMLEVLADNEQFELLAVGDQNGERVKELAKAYGVKGYDDYRSMIVQEPLDVLFLYLPTYLCGDCLRWAAQKGMAVFKRAPLARTVPEGAHWVELMKKNKCSFSVGVPRRFSPSYLEAHQLLAEGRIGEIYLVEAEKFGVFDKEMGWRGDPVLAGGGVLLEWGYHLIDLMLWSMGAPVRVFGQKGAFWSKQSLPPYKTEDTMVVQMRFGNDAVGVVRLGWKTVPASERLVYRGSEGTLVVGPSQIALYGSEGEVVMEETYAVDDKWLLDQQIRHLGACLTDDELVLFSPASEHLASVATIESGYLSARTQMPEELQVYGPFLSFDS